MTAHSGIRFGKLLLFALALLVAASMREGRYGVVTQAIMWLPSGVALAGLWLLGLRAWWVVALCTLIQRWTLGYQLEMSLSAVIGSVAEAVLGVLVLRRLHFRATLARLRDVVAIFLAACLAPLASILFSWFGRSFGGFDPNLPFYSGWDGWWRMNALGVLTAVPLILTWLAAPLAPPTTRTAGRAAAVAAGLVALLIVVLVAGPDGTTGVMMLNLALPITLFAAVRHGPRGAASAGALAAIVVAVATAGGVGPFLAIAPDERHQALQLFELSLVAVPLVFGALIAERKWLEQTTAFEAHVLELVATGCQRSEIFLAIVSGMERLTQDGLCAITLRDGERMRVAMAPSLPASFDAAAEGAEIAPHGLQGRWTVPIRDSAGSVLGSFAVYFRQPRVPEARELASAERAGALAGIVLERERRSEELRRSEDLLASINRNVNEGLFRAIPGGKLVYANPAFARMFGYDSPDEILGVDPALLYADPARREDLLRRLEQCGHIVNEEARFCRQDGTDFWGLVSSTGIRGPDGAAIHYDGTVTDITARKCLEVQLRQSQKMEAVGKLAGGVAHDFNNLLTAIFGYAEAIRDELPATDVAHEYAEEVLQAAERAASLTRQLLAYSRQQVLTPQVLELSAVVDQLGGMLRRVIGEDVRLVTDLTADEDWVRVDRGQLEQVILNLVVNARDAMPGGGTITVGTAVVDVDDALAVLHADLHVGPYVTLRVQDTGIGMSSEIQARAFDPFFTTKEQGKGTGLGLSTVYGIVKQSGGAVWLESQPGEGTTAWITLPRVAAAVASTPAPPKPDAEPLEATVLLAEDEPVVRELVRQILEQSGYRVLDAPDGVEAFEVSRSHAGPIDLVVTDVVMPRMGGRELAARLHVERPGLPVLFMSGYANAAWDRSEFSGQASNFLQKPFAPRDLVDRVRGLLRPGPAGL